MSSITTEDLAEMFEDLLRLQPDKKMYLMTGFVGHLTFKYRIYLEQGKPKLPRKLKKAAIATRRIRKKYKIYAI